MQIAKIIVDVPTMQTNKPWTYKVPTKFEQLILPGMRVEVPFGNGNRQIQGFVTDVSEANEADVNEKIKDITNVIELEPVLNDEMLELGAFLAQKNFAFQISMYQTMLPNVLKAKYSKTIQVVKPDAIDNVDVRHIFADRDEIPFDSNEIDESLFPILKRYQEVGTLRFNYHVQNQAKAKMIRVFKPLLTSAEYDEQRKTLRSTAKKQAKLLTYLMDAKKEFTPIKTALETVALSSADFKQSAEKGWVVIDTVEEYRLPKLSTAVEPTQALQLNAEQQTAYDAIVEPIKADRAKTFLLEGITGSGKTEVYLQSIAQTLEQGKTALMLVPEITLTPQMVRRVQSRFGNDVAVMHSGLSDGERYDEWRRVMRHEAHVVVGARSAIFAPLENLGLIIIDEEHETTYKQDENPRYHARDVALWRADYHQAVVVLGSATPSLESRARAQRGVYKLLTLSQRALNNPLPHAEIIDMRKAIKNGEDEIFSDALIEQINDRLAKSEQSVLMLNRRGYANFLMCRDCGFVPMCPNCDLALTVHQDTNRLECHVCGATQPIPRECSNCGSTRIRPYGTGTQKVEEQLQQRLPEARILRMDVDTTRKKGAADRLLTKFGKQEADILIGTQMIAKGLDFPEVTLVGILNADTTLNLPDYRASERTFQLITQVAGRAGRAQKLGEVIIQTFNPEHYAINLAKEQDYEAFYAKEMQLRHAWKYSPYYFAVQLKFAHETEEEAAKVAYQTAKWLRKMLASDSIIFGPAPGNVRRLKNKYYYQILIKFKNDPGLEIALTELANGAQRLAKNGTILSIDRDPVNLM
ncbi:MAG: primosomal protein N' [Lactobacillaceae bacterium]|jgi:primosomal protein N' (replication factor Y)|nr:primosomal protein N' [Lactobacillaceae bacterium]